MNDLDQILAGEDPVQSEEPVQEVVEEAQPDQQEEVAEEAPAPEPESPSAPEEEPQMVPLSALKEVRAELKALKEAGQQPTERPKAPDMFQDPEGYQKHVQQTIEQSVFNERLNYSERGAREKYGDDSVNEARELFMQQAQQNPALVAALRQQADPYGYVMKWHNQQKVVAEIGDDPDAYKAKLREDIRKELQAELVAENVKQAAETKTPSLAHQPNIGSRQGKAWEGPTSLDDILG